MALYNSRMLVLDRGRARRPRRSLGPVGPRLSRLVRRTAEPGLQSTPPPLTHSALEAGETAGGEPAPRFPLARRGYDCVAVDEYVADLERELTALDRELAELRGSDRPADEVASEIRRVGEQTSAVLMAAHEQRDEILRRAEAEADRRVADATATANTVTAQFEERLRDLKAQIDAANAERARLLGDLRVISAALAGVADSAEERLATTAEIMAPIAT